MTTTVRRTFISVLLLLGFSVAAFAQTHPCDQPGQTNPTILSGAPHKMQFCSPQADNIEAAIARVDGTPTNLLAISAKTGPSSTGKVLYETVVFLQVARGQHTVTLAAYNRNAITGVSQEGAQSAPFPFAAVDETPTPAAPSIQGVVR